MGGVTSSDDLGPVPVADASCEHEPHCDGEMDSTRQVSSASKRDLADPDEILSDGPDRDKKRQRLHSAQLLGHMLCYDESNMSFDSEASTELTDDVALLASDSDTTPPRSRAASMAESTRSRCTSGNSVWRGSASWGLANQCGQLRQDVVGGTRREECPIADVDAGTANLRDGKYLYVIMVANPETVRLLHEDDMDELMDSGLNIGHTSLVDAQEFKRNWASSWDEAEPVHFRRTVLYAGELMFEEGEGVVWWNNQSGHYLPPAEGHTRVGFKPETFAGLC